MHKKLTAKLACDQLAMVIVQRFSVEHGTDWLRIDPKGQRKKIAKWIHTHLKLHFKD